MTRPSVILAPDLLEEKWWSMDYYWREFQRNLPLFGNEFNFQVALPISNSSKFVKRHFHYPQQIQSLLSHSQAPQLLHVLDHSYGHLCRADFPCVVSCHDLAEWRTPTLPFYSHQMWKYRVRGIQKAKHFFALSESTSRDLQEIFNIPQTQITVNPLGIDSQFKPIAIDEEDFNQYPQLGLLRETKAAGFSLILHVGSNIERKNLPTLLGALKRLIDQGEPVCLIKVGESLFKSKYSSLIHDLQLRDHLIEIEGPSVEELQRIYALSDLLSFPSTYEGQGLPVLEAQACGLPCVISMSSSLTEVGGDSVLYHDPLNSEELAAQIERVMDSPELRSNLVQKGFENVKQFTWKEHFNRLVGVYRRLTV